MTEINTSAELFTELKDSNQRRSKQFTQIPAEEFFTPVGVAVKIKFFTKV